MLEVLSQPIAGVRDDTENLHIYIAIVYILYL